MKVRYQFTNEVVEIEVSEEWGEVLVDLDRQEYNTNQRETRRHVSLDMVMQDQGMQFADPDSLPTTEQTEALAAAVCALTKAQQEVIRAVLWEGLTISDFARMTGVSQQAASQRFHVALKNLCKLLERPCE